MSVRARRESSGEPSSILKYHSAPDVCRLVAVTPTSPRSHSLLIDSALWVSDYLPDSTYNLTFILLFVYYDRFNPPLLCDPPIIPCRYDQLLLSATDTSLAPFSSLIRMTLSTRFF